MQKCVYLSLHQHKNRALYGICDKKPLGMEFRAETFVNNGHATIKSRGRKCDAYSPLSTMLEVERVATINAHWDMGAMPEIVLRRDTSVP